MILFLLFLVVAASAVSFALQNGDYIAVSFLNWHFDEPLALFLLIAFVAGFFAALFLSLSRLIRVHNALKQANKELKALKSLLATTGGIEYESDSLTHRDTMSADIDDKTSKELPL